MSNRIESTILRNLLSNPEFTVRAIPYIKTEYFEQNSDKIAFGVIRDHIEIYQRPPNKEALEITLGNIGNIAENDLPALESLVDEITDPAVAPSDLKWVTDAAENWCRERSVINALYDAISITNGSDKNRTTHAIPQLMQEAVNVSFQTELGHDYVEDAEKRWDMYQILEGNRIPFDIDMLNKITKGGLLPKTLNVITAPPNVGKSLWLCSIAASALKAGRNVIYITLEMATEQIGKRIDANLFDIGLDDLEKLNKEQFMRHASSLKNMALGKLIIKEYPTTTASAAHFKQFINDCKMKKSGFTPDLVIVDYINICASAKLKNNGTTGSYAYIKTISEELRCLAMELEIAVLTATQINREGSKSEDPSMADTADSFGLPMTADWQIALVTNEELARAGKILVKQLKSRYADVTKWTRFLVGMSRSKQRLYNVEQEEGEADYHEPSLTDIYEAQKKSRAKLEDSVDGDTVVSFIGNKLRREREHGIEV